MYCDRNSHRNWKCQCLGSEYKVHFFQQRVEPEEGRQGEGGTAAVDLCAVFHAARPFLSSPGWPEISFPSSDFMVFQSPRDWVSPASEPALFTSQHFTQCTSLGLHHSSPPPLPRPAAAPHTSLPCRFPSTSPSCCAPNWPCSSAVLIPSSKVLCLQFPAFF